MNKIDELFFWIMERLFPKVYKNDTEYLSLEDLKNNKFKKEHPILSRIEDIYFTISGAIKNILFIPKRIKWFFQRAKRGYADCDLWEFGTYISGVIKDALEDFRKNSTSYPGHITYKKWLEILDNMVYSFDIVYKTMYDKVLMSSLKELKKHPKKWKKYAKELNAKLLTEEEIKKYDRGMKLFIKYIFDLWD